MDTAWNQASVFVILDGLDLLALHVQRNPIVRVLVPAQNLLDVYVKIPWKGDVK